jgi:DNA ligase-1
MTKPYLACDADLDKQKFPVILMPKIDGVRALALDGPLTGRSLKRFPNVFVNRCFDRFEYNGFDGELALKGMSTHPDLCRGTTSVTSSKDKTNALDWWLFDYLTPESRSLPYIDRLALRDIRYNELKDKGLADNLRLVPWIIAKTKEEVLAMDDLWLSEGYEGSIMRALDLPHKEGRSTVREGGYLRIKGFMEANAMVNEITEGNKNGNVAQKNELGKTFRTSHQENMIPNGMLGNMLCTLMEDVFDAHSKKLLLKKGDKITVSPGNMTEKEALDFWQNPGKIVEKVIKFKFFPKGIKTKPRFPTWVCIRDDYDLVDE